MMVYACITMEAPRNIEAHKKEYFAKIHKSLSRIENIAGRGKISFNGALKAIKELKPLYEDVNQAHHEILCLAALQYLKDIYGNLKWFWHPTSTGTGEEADLEGRDENGKLIVAAECSASIKAKGTLRVRMNLSLEKLHGLQVRQRYYFVVNEDMKASAKNRTVNYGYDINVERISTQQ